MCDHTGGEGEPLFIEWLDLCTLHVVAIHTTFIANIIIR